MESKHKGMIETGLFIGMTDKGHLGTEVGFCIFLISLRPNPFMTIDIRGIVDFTAQRELEINWDFSNEVIRNQMNLHQ